MLRHLADELYQKYVLDVERPPGVKVSKETFTKLLLEAYERETAAARLEALEDALNVLLVAHVKDEGATFNDAYMAIREMVEATRNRVVVYERKKQEAH